MLTQANIKEILHYCHETGVFTWIRKSKLKHNASIGNVAGYRHHTGYRLIGINNKQYSSHRLAWLYMTGEWPVVFIDHINGIKDDNSFLNLRLANRVENSRNRGAQASNTSGYKGVTWNKAAQKWQAQIGIGGSKKLKYLGLFDNPKIAHKKYCKAALVLHGEFSNTGTGTVL